MACKDKSVNYLRGLGYNVVLVPKADLAPTELLAREDGRLRRFGPLGEVLEGQADVTAPATQADLPAPSISGQRSSSLSLGVGLSILGDIIGAMGGGKLGLEAEHRTARSISFEFHDVLEDRTTPAELDRFLSGADVRPFSRYARRLLEADDMFVVTSVLKSRAVRVAAESARGQQVQLDASAIQQVVGGEVAVTAAQDASMILDYRGERALAFAFQAEQLIYEDGAYARMRALDDDAALRSLGADQPPGPITPGAFVRLDVA